MNAYIATTIFAELKEILQGCCRYSSRCSKICAASGTAVLLPIAFWLQFAATITDEWMLVTSTSLDENNYFGCFTSAYEDSRCLCVLEITSNVILFLLMIIGFGVCCRTCCHSITLNSCKVCFVCIISLISLIPVVVSSQSKRTHVHIPTITNLLPRYEAEAIATNEGVNGQLIALPAGSRP
ncbi:uncharacterized protein LOC123541799 [Mercenaria mercenaria]|uniref:uncharacterized protein LOC123541799 n=1 Tax=Mercenaria mercenaria TaxID=6596 RepID=UPI00234F5244|nr:uncharacterized protein LOC123541799 [Mercenaria mercenaria]XP_053387013.1 uncharacterized protein LOC123541799 [Mercenaria mercenaria]